MPFKNESPKPGIAKYPAVIKGAAADFPPESLPSPQGILFLVHAYKYVRCAQMCRTCYIHGKRQAIKEGYLFDILLRRTGVHGSFRHLVTTVFSLYHVRAEKSTGSFVKTSSEKARLFLLAIPFLLCYTRKRLKEKRGRRNATVLCLPVKLTPQFAVVFPV